MRISTGSLQGGNHNKCERILIGLRCTCGWQRKREYLEPEVEQLQLQLPDILLLMHIDISERPQDMYAAGTCPFS